MCCDDFSVLTVVVDKKEQNQKGRPADNAPLPLRRIPADLRKILHNQRLPQSCQHYETAAHKPPLPGQHPAGLPLHENRSPAGATLPHRVVHRHPARLHPEGPPEQDQQAEVRQHKGEPEPGHVHDPAGRAAGADAAGHPGDAHVGSLRRHRAELAGEQRGGQFGADAAASDELRSELSEESGGVLCSVCGYGGESQAKDEQFVGVGTCSADEVGN